MKLNRNPELTMSVLDRVEYSIEYASLCASRAAKRTLDDKN